MQLRLRERGSRGAAKKTTEGKFGFLHSFSQLTSVSLSLSPQSARRAHGTTLGENELHVQSLESCKQAARSAHKVSIVLR
mmetsp:Transcript_25992/g.76907  ORF Transcript_25992/g.76907 Transcript_25992/m.76907 type:complete len:80 (+) Transcript_25992:85-324(+)